MTDTKLYDCIIQAGELDESGYHYLDNDLYLVETAKHNVTLAEVNQWLGSPECMKRIHELEDMAAERFGEHFHAKYSANYFFCSADKDEKKGEEHQ